MKKDHYELVILGGGPAGLSAGLYAARARLDHILIEKGSPGGQVLTTDWVDNYPGFREGLSGFDLMEKMVEHARRFEVNIENSEVERIETGDGKSTSLRLLDGTIITCDSLIISTGARPNLLGVPGEEELRGKGVSYCGTCDAPFYRNLNVAVIGGGDTAVEEAIYLTRFANKVTLVHRRDEQGQPGLSRKKRLQMKRLILPGTADQAPLKETTLCKSSILSTTTGRNRA